MIPRQSENPFFLLAENALDGICIETGGLFTYLNPAALALFRAATACQLLGRPVIERIPPDRRAAVADGMERLLASGQGLPAQEQTCLRLDGTPVEVEMSAVPFSDQGEASAILFIRDITERRRREQALKSLHRDFVTLLENTSDFIYFKDQDSRFRFCSQTLADITGHQSWRDMMGKHDLEVFPPDTAQVYYEEELPIFREGRPLLDRTDPYYDEAGQPGWVNTNKWPVLGEDGKSVVGIFGISRIVTERVRAEAEQHRLNRTLQLANASNTALLHAEQEEKLLADICRLIVEEGGYLMAWVGFRQQDADRTVRPVAGAGNADAYLDGIRISWADTELGRGPVGTAIRTGQAMVVQDALTDPGLAPWRDAAIRRGYRSVIALPLLVDGAVLGALNIYGAQPQAFCPEEIRLLEKLADNLAFGIEGLRAKTRLAKANQELQTFTYAASHDLKGPLGRINIFSNLLEKRCRTRLDGEELQFLDFIRENASRLNSLVDDLLAHAQIEEQAMHLQPVDLRAAVQAAIREQASGIEECGATVRFDLPAAQVQADPHSLAQVLRNLLDNALKYSSQAKPPRVEIGGEVQGNRCRFWVRDNGIGFDMAFQGRIFEIFRRLHTYQEYPGSGIGLALVKKAVGRMGGRVWAESAPGQGATFFVELPV